MFRTMLGTSYIAKVWQPSVKLTPILLPSLQYTQLPSFQKETAILNFLSHGDWRRATEYIVKRHKQGRHCSRREYVEFSKHVAHRHPDLIPKIWRTLPQSAGIASFNVGLTALVASGHFERAIALFQSDLKEFSPDHYTFNTIMKAYALTGRSLDQILQTMDRRNLAPDLATYSTLIKYMPAKAFHWWKEMRNRGLVPDSAAWRTFLMEQTNPSASMQAWQELLQSDVAPTAALMDAFFAGCKTGLTPEQLESVFDSVRARGRLPTRLVVRSLLTFPYPEMLEKYTAQLRAEIGSSDADPLAWEALIKAYGQLKKGELLHELLKDMKQRRLLTDRLQEAFARAFGTANEILPALYAFDEVPVKTRTSYIGLLGAYARSLDLEATTAVWRQLKADNINPDPALYSIMLLFALRTKQKELWSEILEEAVQTGQVDAQMLTQILRNSMSRGQRVCSHCGATSPDWTLRCACGQPRPSLFQYKTQRTNPMALDALNRLITWSYESDDCLSTVFEWLVRNQLGERGRELFKKLQPTLQSRPTVLAAGLNFLYPARYQALVAATDTQLAYLRDQKQT